MNLLRTLRICNGLTLREAAAAAAMSASALSMIERGQRSGSRSSLLRLAKVYGIDTDVALLAGGQVPNWLKESLRKYPQRSRAAGADAFRRYGVAEQPSDGEKRSPAEGAPA